MDKALGELKRQVETLSRANKAMKKDIAALHQEQKDSADTDGQAKRLRAEIAELEEAKQAEAQALQASAAGLEAELEAARSEKAEAEARVHTASEEAQSELQAVREEKAGVEERLTAASETEAELTEADRLAVLGDVASELVRQGSREAAACLAHRILRLDGLQPGQGASTAHTALLAELAAEFATAGQFESASALAHRVGKLDSGNASAHAVVKFAREQARAWAKAGGAHVPGVHVGREHADRAAYAINASRPRPRKPASLNPRLGARSSPRK